MHYEDLQLGRSSAHSAQCCETVRAPWDVPFVVLQDVLHRVAAPSQLAEGRPRFSLVWKLAFLPRSAVAVACLARPEWGPSTAFGSAARLEAMQRSVASRKRKPGTVR